MSDYARKFERIALQTPYQDLPLRERGFVRAQALRHRFTLQELRQVSEIARDLANWKEGGRETSGTVFLSKPVRNQFFCTVKKYFLKNFDMATWNRVTF